MDGSSDGADDKMVAVNQSLTGLGRVGMGWDGIDRISGD